MVVPVRGVPGERQRKQAEQRDPGTQLGRNLLPVPDRQSREPQRDAIAQIAETSRPLPAGMAPMYRQTDAGVTGSPGFSSAVSSTNDASAPNAHSPAATTAARRVGRSTGSVSSGRSKPSNLGSIASPAVATAPTSSRTLATGIPHSTIGGDDGSPGTGRGSGHCRPQDRRDHGGTRQEQGKSAGTGDQSGVARGRR